MRTIFLFLFLLQLYSASLETKSVAPSEKKKKEEKEQGTALHSKEVSISGILGSVSCIPKISRSRSKTDKTVCGEDNYLLSEVQSSKMVQYSAVGVMDGVGSCKDAAMFTSYFKSQFIKLLSDKSLVERNWNNFEAIVWWGVHMVSDDLIRDSRVDFNGETTLSFVVFDSLGAAKSFNLGDSGHLIIRDQEILLETKKQRNNKVPFQTGIVAGPDGINYVQTNYKPEIRNFLIFPGDVFFAATDGVFDNLYLEDKLSSEVFKKKSDSGLDSVIPGLKTKLLSLSESVASQMPMAFSEPDKVILAISGVIKKATEEIVIEANKYSLRTNYKSPAAAEDKTFFGGKKDDVTVTINVFMPRRVVLQKNWCTLDTVRKSSSASIELREAIGRFMDSVNRKLFGVESSCASGEEMPLLKTLWMLIFERINAVSAELYVAILEELHKLSGYIDWITAVDIFVFLQTVEDQASYMKLRSYTVDPVFFTPWATVISFNGAYFYSNHLKVVEFANEIFKMINSSSDLFDEHQAITYHLLLKNSLFLQSQNRLAFLMQFIGIEHKFHQKTLLIIFHSFIHLKEWQKQILSFLNTSNVALIAKLSEKLKKCDQKEIHKPLSEFGIAAIQTACVNDIKMLPRFLSWMRSLQLSKDHEMQIIQELLRIKVPLSMWSSYFDVVDEKSLLKDSYFLIVSLDDVKIFNSKICVRELVNRKDFDVTTVIRLDLLIEFFLESKDNAILKAKNNAMLKAKDNPMLNAILKTLFGKMKSLNKEDCVFAAFDKLNVTLRKNCIPILVEEFDITVKNQKFFEIIFQNFPTLFLFLDASSPKLKQLLTNVLIRKSYLKYFVCEKKYVDQSYLKTIELEDLISVIQFKDCQHFLDHVGSLKFNLSDFYSWIVKNQKTEKKVLNQNLLSNFFKEEYLKKNSSSVFISAFMIFLKNNGSLEKKYSLREDVILKVLDSVTDADSYCFAWCTAFNAKLKVSFTHLYSLYASHRILWCCNFELKSFKDLHSRISMSSLSSTEIKGIGDSLMTDVEKRNKVHPFVVFAKHTKSIQRRLNSKKLNDKQILILVNIFRSGYVLPYILSSNVLAYLSKPGGVFYKSFSENSDLRLHSDFITLFANGGTVTVNEWRLCTTHSEDSKALVYDLFWKELEQFPDAAIDSLFHCMTGLRKMPRLSTLRYSLSLGTSNKYEIGYCQLKRDQNATEVNFFLNQILTDCKKK